MNRFTYISLFFVGLFIVSIPHSTRSFGVLFRLLLEETPFTRMYPNFFTVEKGKVYRTKQPKNKKAFEKMIKQYKINTIINLRGEKPGAKWWEDEVKLTLSHGLTLYNIPIKGHKTVQPQQLREILIALDAKPPLLIHCRQGRDRTSLVSALYLIEKRGQSYEQAKKQLASKPYGHVSLFYPKIKKLVKMWSKWRVQQGLSREQALRNYEEAVSKGWI